MAVASVTRTTPGGTMLKDGYSTKIGFEDDLDIEFWEKTVTPGGYDGGDPIDITTMWNSAVRTKASRTLYDSTDGSAVVAYDPIAIESIKSIINVESIITYSFPDGSTDSRYGYLRSFEPNELAEGSHPEATVSIVHTNRNADTDAEEAGTIVDGS